jgi:ankyrin repeat protein
MGNIPTRRAYATTDDGDRRLLYSGRDGEVELVEYLLDEVLDIDLIRGIDSLTALVHAIFGGHLLVIKVLLQCGANAQVKDCCGQIPLHITARNGFLEGVQHVIETEDVGPESTR